MTSFALPASPPARPDFSDIDNWVFDLDNTLYPRRCNLFAQIDLRITDYVVATTRLEFAAARAVEPAPAAAPEAAPTAAGALSGEATPIETIAANPAGKAVLDKDLPGLTTHEAYDQFKGMTLVQVAPMSQGAITPEALKTVQADLDKIGK